LISTANITVRPVVLSPEHAREWVDPETTPERAAQIATECCRPTEEFTWFEVSKDVGNVRNQGPNLISPVPGPAGDLE